MGSLWVSKNFPEKEPNKFILFHFRHLLPVWFYLTRKRIRSRDQLSDYVSICHVRVYFDIYFVLDRTPVVIAVILLFIQYIVFTLNILRKWKITYAYGRSQESTACLLACFRDILKLSRTNRRAEWYELPRNSHSVCYGSDVFSLFVLFWFKPVFTYCFITGFIARVIFRFFSSYLSFFK